MKKIKEKRIEKEENKYKYNYVLNIIIARSTLFIYINKVED